MSDTMAYRPVLICQFHETLLATVDPGHLALSKAHVEFSDAQSSFYDKFTQCPTPCPERPASPSLDFLLLFHEEIPEAYPPTTPATGILAEDHLEMEPVDSFKEAIEAIEALKSRYAVLNANDNSYDTSLVNDQK